MKRNKLYNNTTLEGFLTILLLARKEEKKNNLMVNCLENGRYKLNVKQMVIFTLKCVKKTFYTEFFCIEILAIRWWFCSGIIHSIVFTSKYCFNIFFYFYFLEKILFNNKTRSSSVDEEEKPLKFCCTFDTIFEMD